MPEISSNLRLTRRQAQVLEMLRQGMGKGEIAARLGICRRTVEDHQRLIHEKSGSNNIRHALAFYYESTLRPEFAPPERHAP